MANTNTGGTSSTTHRHLNRDCGNIPVKADVDVLVVGVGPAGIAASIASARMGARTMIIERYGFLGGCATISGVTTVCGLFRSDQGSAVPVIKGIAWEIVEMLRNRGAASDPCPIGKTFLIVFDDQVLKEIAEDLLLQSNVDILYHAFATDVMMAGDEISGVLIESKAGLQAVHAKCVIDATGDGDVVARTPNPYQKGKSGILQFPTLMFKMGNVDLEKIRLLSRENLEAIMIKASQSNEFNLPRVSGTVRIIPGRAEVLCNMTKIMKDDGYVDGTNPTDLTYAEIEGRKQVRAYGRLLRKYVEGFEEAYVSSSGPQIGIRETRLIQGGYLLTENDIVDGRKFEDAILRSAWPMEIHGADKGTTWQWVSNGDYYDIPLRCLIPSSVDNLLMAGRCISTTHEAQASTRVSACCYGTGQAAGVVAALSVDRKCHPREIDYADVQARLREQGALV
jgi:hypothetical protein